MQTLSPKRKSVLLTFQEAITNRFTEEKEQILLDSQGAHLEVFPSSVHLKHTEWILYSLHHNETPFNLELLESENHRTF